MPFRRSSALSFSLIMVVGCRGFALGRGCGFGRLSPGRCSGPYACRKVNYSFFMYIRRVPIFLLLRPSSCPVFPFLRLALPVSLSSFPCRCPGLWAWSRRLRLCLWDFLPFLRALRPLLEAFVSVVFGRKQMWFRSETDVASAENRCGVGRNHLTRCLGALADCLALSLRWIGKVILCPAGTA